MKPSDSPAFFSPRGIKGNAEGRRAFTLVELMVAVAVLTILVSVLASAANLIILTFNQERAKVESNQAARDVLQQIGMDLQNMVIRSDVDYSFVQQKGNDTLAFYATESGYFAASPKRIAAVVNYAIANNTSGSPVLQRGVNDMFQWNAGSEGGMIFTSTPTLQSANPSFATLEPSSPDILNQAVVRMELSFLLKKTTTGAPAIAASLTNGNSISDVAAIIVTIATLDSRHRAMLGTSATAWNNLINALHDSADTKCTGEVWETALATPGFAQTSGIPPEVASGIRVYERYFYLSSVPQSATSSQNP